MNKETLKRLEKIEDEIGKSFVLLCTLPSGKQKTMTVTEYIQHSEPLSFSVVSGDSPVEAATIFQKLWNHHSATGYTPQIDAGSSITMENQRILLDTLTHPAPNRDIDAFD